MLEHATSHAHTCCICTAPLHVSGISLRKMHGIFPTEKSLDIFTASQNSCIGSGGVGGWGGLDFQRMFRDFYCSAFFKRNDPRFHHCHSVVFSVSGSERIFTFAKFSSVVD